MRIESPRLPRFSSKFLRKMRGGLGSGCLDDTARSNASGANAGLLADTVDYCFHAAKIRVPPAPRDIVRVADRIAETRLLAANFTCHCHRRSNSKFSKTDNFSCYQRTCSPESDLLERVALNVANGTSANRIAVVGKRRSSPRWLKLINRFFNAQLHLLRVPQLISGPSEQKSGVSEFANSCKCTKIKSSSCRGRVAQLGEHLLCKTQGQSHKCRIWCRLRGTRTVQPTS